MVHGAPGSDGRPEIYCLCWFRASASDCRYFTEGISGAWKHHSSRIPRQRIPFGFWVSGEQQEGSWDLGGRSSWDAVHHLRQKHCRHGQISRTIPLLVRGSSLLSLDGATSRYIERVEITCPVLFCQPFLQGQSLSSNDSIFELLLL